MEKMIKPINIETKIYEECTGGILICGINWGGNETDRLNEDSNYKTFFSNENRYNWKFRNRILKWFELWEHKLVSKEKDIGKFEKSISYTNWLCIKSKNFDGKSILHECVKNNQIFINTLEFLKPRLIFFMSNQLLEAFNSKECLPKAIELFGIKTKEKIYSQQDIIIERKKLRRFKIGFQSFDKCDIISLPHPTGSRNLSDAYIESFKNEIGNIINKWKINNTV